MFLKSRAEAQNLDTKLPSPLACVAGMMFVRPAMYPQRMIPKHSSRAGRSLSIDMLGGRGGVRSITAAEDGAINREITHLLADYRLLISGQTGKQL